MNLPVWFPPLVSGLAAVALLIKGFSNLKKARTIEDVPTSKIRSAPQGYVELIGITLADHQNLQAAPLTGTPCLWYDFKIERYQGGKNSHWITVESGDSDAGFLIEDGTGSCTIQPARSQVLTTHRKRWTGYQRHPGRSEEISLLGRLRRQRYRYTERRIHPDQPIYAIGWFQTIQPPSRKERLNANTAQILAAWKQDYSKVLERFDTNNDGNIDLHEWEQARQEARRTAMNAVEDDPQPDGLNILCKPANGQTFLLSTRDPRELSRHFRHNSMWQLAGAAGAAGFFLWIFTTQGA